MGSVVLLTAERVLTALADESRAIVGRAAERDRAANGDDVLRALVGRLEIGAAGTVPFTGVPDSVRFSSWCEVPSGWLESCTVTLAFERTGAARALTASIDGRSPLVLVAGLRDGAFRYLESAAAGGQWFQRWGTGITAPLGIGVITERGAVVDTTLLPIGPRG